MDERNFKYIPNSILPVLMYHISLEILSGIKDEE